MGTDSSSGQTPTLDADRLLDLLYRRDVVLAHHRSALARRLRVSQTEVLALSHLVHHGDMTAAGLAELLDLSSGGVTALVQRLEAGGHVTRHPHPGDRRSTLLRVAPAAADALTEAEESLRAGLDALATSLSKQQQATVAAFLTALAELFEELATAQRGDRVRTGEALDHPVPSLWA